MRQIIYYEIKFIKINKMVLEYRIKKRKHFVFLCIDCHEEAKLLVNLIIKKNNKKYEKPRVTTICYHKSSNILEVYSSLVLF